MNKKGMNQKETSASWFVFIATLCNTILYHYPLALFAVSRLDETSLNGVLTLITLLILEVAITAFFLFCLLIINTMLTKIISIILALINSVALYFMQTYHAMLDLTMVDNILNTQFSEASSYFHPTLFIYLFFLGIVPSWFIARIKFSKISRFKLLTQAISIVVITILWFYINASTWLWFDKYSKLLGAQIMPWSYVFNTYRYYSNLTTRSPEQKELPRAHFKKSTKTVVVLIIGETARKANFSLYGYTRETNPLLKNSGVIALNNPTACSTYTTESIACILSHKNESAPEYEPLTSYLQRHDVDVIWRTRNWGEPPMNVASYQKRGDLKKLCSGEKCRYDELLLSGLLTRINASKKQKIFIVLHTKGSHGPSYYLRYPKQFEKFTPVCQSVELDKCTQEELINAYDNTIIYADYFIKQTIDKLKELTIPSTLIYASDHGESLGEYGLYLHGTPASIAPDVQLEIPMLVWMSDNFINAKNIDINTINQSKQYGHAHIFHSVMGAFNMESSIYKKNYDIFNKQ